MRLIDADELIKRFKELKGADSLANMFVTDVINEIKKQPTAYDVDKVVEQLKKKLLFHEGHLEETGWAEDKGCIESYEHAIEIVKSSGIE